MEPQQVFETYIRDATASSPVFCPHCGTAWSSDATSPPTCATCGRRTFLNAFPAVSVLVIDAGRFLLCRRAGRSFEGSKWCLPSGFVEYGEDFLTAARREVLEETGIEVAIEGILSVVSNFFRPDLHSLVVVLRARPAITAAALSAGDDADDARWFDDPGELPEMAFEADTHIIRRVFATGLQGVPVDGRFR